MVFIAQQIIKINLYSISPDPNSNNSLDREENHPLKISAAKQKLSILATMVEASATEI